MNIFITEILSAKEDIIYDDNTIYILPHIRYEATNLLSDNVINFAFGGEEATYEPHPSTVGYVRSLLLPYVDAIEQITNIASILIWISQTFPGEIARRITINLNASIIREHHYLRGDHELISDEIIRGPVIDIITENIPEILMVAKHSVVGYLLYELIAGADSIIRNTQEENTILPWDILHGIIDNELTSIFGITSDRIELPVTFTINDEERIKLMSADYVMGMLIAADTITTANIDFSMFGSKLSLGHFTDPSVIFNVEGFRYMGDPLNWKESPYTVAINGITYGFKTTEFMQGFEYVANLFGVDHHLYWSDLKSHALSLKEV